MAFTARLGTIDSRLGLLPPGYPEDPGPSGARVALTGLAVVGATEANARMARVARAVVGHTGPSEAWVGRMAVVVWGRYTPNRRRLGNRLLRNPAPEAT